MFMYHKFAELKADVNNSHKLRTGLRRFKGIETILLHDVVGLGIKFVFDGATTSVYVISAMLDCNPQSYSNSNLHLSIEAAVTQRCLGLSYMGSVDLLPMPQDCLQH